MKISRFAARSAFSILFLFDVVLAGPHTANKNKACPDSWGLTDKVINVVQSTDNPWGVVAGGVDDKAIAKTHLSKAKPIETIDKAPITSDDLVNDPLTVASECLLYRNFEVDTWDYVLPPPAAPNPATGWIPAVIY